MIKASVNVAGSDFNQAVGVEHNCGTGHNFHGHSLSIRTGLAIQYRALFRSECQHVDFGLVRYFQDGWTGIMKRMFHLMFDQLDP